MSKNQIPSLQKETATPLQSHRRIGLAILITLYIIATLFAGFAYQLPNWFRPRDWGALLVFAGIAFTSAQFAFFSIWFGLAPHGLISRFVFVLLAAIVGSCAICLGILLSLETDTSLTRNREIYAMYLTGLTGPLLAGAAIPLLVIRYGFNRVMVIPGDRPGRQRPVLTIAGLFTGTGIVAVILGGIHVATYAVVNPLAPNIDDVNGIWFAAGIGAAIFMGVSLISAVPAAMLLLNDRLSFWIYYLLFCAYSLFAAMVTVLVLSVSWRWQSEFFGFGFSVFLYGVILATACGGLRLIGYRIQKTTDGKA